MLENYLEQYVEDTLEKMKEYWEREEEKAEKKLREIKYTDTIDNPKLAAHYRILEDTAIAAIARQGVYEMVIKELTDLLERHKKEELF